MKRRDFLKIGSAFGAAAPFAGCRCPFSSCERVSPIPYAANLRDRCWMWGHDTGVYDGPDGKGGLKYNIPGSEPITMADACGRMGIPNVCVIRWDAPSEEYLEQFKTMKRLSWVICGDSKPEMFREWHDRAMRLFRKMPNMVGFDLDDFFFRTKSYLEDGEMVALGHRTRRQLRALHDEVHSLGRPADLRIVFYERDLASPVAPILREVDTVLFWTWSGSNLANLRQNFSRLRAMVPDKPVLLGIYMWDFGGARPLPMDFMKGQLDVAYDLFKRGEVDGFIFHCTPLVNKNLEAVEYARGWIDRHADETRA